MIGCSGRRRSSPRAINLAKEEPMLKRFVVVALAALAFASAAVAEPVAKFGIITDIHHTNRPDSSTRFYSASLPKTQYFVDTMNAADAEFVVEMGDFVDLLVDNMDPLVNLDQVESIYTSFEGPQYHILGNHEFDNVTREQFLYNIVNTGIPQGETYYSFDTAGIHCVVLDADYTVAPPHRPFDLELPGEDWWTWQDAWIPQEELDWLAADLAATDLPTIVFSHQLLNRDDSEAHTIKNATVVRGILEDAGCVIAHFAGHDHAGGYAEINGIHYLVLEGNVGEGTDPVTHNQFVLVELNTVTTSRDGVSYQLLVTGHGQQGSYDILLTDVVMVENPHVPGEQTPAAAFTLDQNFPNPFNPSTTIAFDLARTEHVSLSVFDMQGRLVRTLVNEARAAGPYSVVWDGVGDDGRRAASGSYVYRLESDSQVQSRTMVLVK
jgi:alkaline phosphatase